MEETLGAAGINQVIDEVDCYTTVYSTEMVGPGGAPHKYAVRDKEGKMLGAINFQNGPIKEAGINGVTNENLLAIVLDRLRGFQDGPYMSRYNALALTRVEEALLWLRERTRQRKLEGKEGTSKI